MNARTAADKVLSETVRITKSCGADQFELYFHEQKNTEIEAKDQKIDSLCQSEDAALAIRVLKNQRLGFSYTTALDSQSLERTVKDALAVSEVMAPDPLHDLFDFGSVAYPSIDATDDKQHSVSLEEKMDWAMRLERECRAADSRIVGVRSAGLHEVHTHVSMADSSGERVHYDESLWMAAIDCKAVENEESQTGYDFNFSNYLDKLDPAHMGKAAAQKATELLGAKQPKSGTRPAVFRNDVASQLLSFLAPSFCADQIDKGRSMLGSRLQDRVFSERIKIVDHGVLPGGLATCSFDAEGVPTQKTVVVDGGVFAQALHDRYYAKKRSAESTGNSIRSFKAPPSIGTTNFYVESGKSTFEQLISEIDHGVLITDLMGLHTANSVTGEFSLGASGISIEKGKLTTPLRGFAVAGNVIELLNEVDAVANDLRFFGSKGSPALRVNKLALSGT